MKADNVNLFSLMVDRGTATIDHKSVAAAGRSPAIFRYVLESGILVDDDNIPSNMSFKCLQILTTLRPPNQQQLDLLLFNCYIIEVDSIKMLIDMGANPRVVFPPMDRDFLSYSLESLVVFKYIIQKYPLTLSEIESLFDSSVHNQDIGAVRFFLREKLVPLQLIQAVYEEYSWWDNEYEIGQKIRGMLIKAGARKI
jgi:hypothetical protein